MVWDAGAAALAAALRTEACQLTSLDLRVNYFGEAKKAALAAALRTDVCQLWRIGLLV